VVAFIGFLVFRRTRASDSDGEPEPHENDGPTPP
jgi:hypothetical protein